MCCYSQHPEIHWIFQGYFTVQLSRFFVSLSFSATACLLYLIKSVLSRTFFHFFESFSFDRFCTIRHLKRDNFDSLSCVVLFVKNFFVLFWKSFQNHVVLCQIMSYPAVSLTIIPLVFYSVNHFLIIFSLASEQQRLNFTLLWHLVLPKSWFSKWNSFFNPQHTSFFFYLLRLYAFSASIRHFWCQIGQVLHKWLITFLQPLTSLVERGIKCTIFPLHHPIKIRVSKGGFQFGVCQIAQNRTCFVPLSENKKN